MRKKLSPYHSYFYDRAKDRIDLKLEDEDQPFEARSEIIQDAHAAHKDIVKYLEDNFKDELSHYKENIFPRAWMLKDTIIQKAMQQHPKFIPIMNALHNRNRHSNGTELIKIQQEVNRMSHGRANLVLEEFRIKKGITRLREAIKTYGKTGESNLKIKELQLGKRLRKGGQISREEINLNRKIDELAANKNELKGDIYLSYFITNDALYKDLHKQPGFP